MKSKVRQWDSVQSQPEIVNIWGLVPTTKHHYDQTITIPSSLQPQNRAGSLKTGSSHVCRSLSNSQFEMSAIEADVVKQ